MFYGHLAGVGTITVINVLYLLWWMDWDRACADAVARSEQERADVLSRTAIVDKFDMITNTDTIMQSPSGLPLLPLCVPVSPVLDATADASVTGSRSVRHDGGTTSSIRLAFGVDSACIGSAAGDDGTITETGAHDSDGDDDDDAHRLRHVQVTGNGASDGSPC